MALRAMCKTKQMSQADLRRASKELDRPLTQSMISRMESLTAALPNLDSIVRYAAACGAPVELSFAFGAADNRNVRPVILS